MKATSTPVLGEALLQLGMKRKHGVVYLTLLQLGPSTAYAIAERSGLKRPYVYVLLGELVAQGAVRRIPHARKQVFQAKNPEQLYRERLAQLRTVEDALPRLEALVSKDPTPTTLYFDGAKGLRHALEYGLDDVARGELLGFFAGASSSKEERSFQEEYARRLEAAGVRLRGFVPDQPGTRERLGEVSPELAANIRVLPREEYDADVSLEIGPSFLRFYSLADQQAVVLANPRVARAIAQVFEMLWTRLQPPARTVRRKKRA